MNYKERQAALDEHPLREPLLRVTRSFIATWTAETHRDNLRRIRIAPQSWVEQYRVWACSMHRTLIETLVQDESPAVDEQGPSVEVMAAALERVLFEAPPEKAVRQYVPGDWVRFQRACILEIAEVRYIVCRPGGDVMELITDKGTVQLTEILEMRRG